MPSSKSLIPHQAMEPDLYGYSAQPSDQSGALLSHYLWLLRHHRWKILAFVVLCVAASVALSALVTPVYESIATMDIDYRMPLAVVGQDAAPRASSDADQFFATQIKLIQSDSVLRPVVSQYHLEASDKRASGSAAEKAAADAPIVLKQLSVIRPPNTYLLQIGYRSPDRNLAANVANALVKSYVERTYDIRFHSSASMSSFMEKQIEELKAKMDRSSAALIDFERELNIINPEQKTSILSARLLQLNTEFTNAQTDRVRKESAWHSIQSGSLESAQASTQGENLKTLSGRLDEARQKFAEVKIRYGDNHPEYRKAAAQIDEIERQLRDSRNNAALRVEIEYRESAARETMLEKNVAATKDEFDQLNAHSIEYQAMKREAEGDKSLYEELMRKIKEAGINSGFQNSAIRIAEPARPALNPVFPILWLNVLVAFVFSSLLAFSAAVVSDLLDKSIRDPGQIATLFKFGVIGELPFVKSWRRRVASRPAGEGADLALVLPDEALPIRRERTVTGFEEAIRALRNSILLGTPDGPLRSLLITSAGPAEGKTTTAVYLAIAHSQLKHKTLLIDCHLRRPGVHSTLGINPESGLAAVVQKNFPWRDGLVKLEEFPDLDILPTGQTGRRSGPRSSAPQPKMRLDILPCRRAADVIGTYLPKILEEAADDYNLVIIDAPPILGLPEPLQMAAAVDGVVVILKAGSTNRGAVSGALDALQRVGANVIGLVLNELTSETSDSHNYVGYYENYQKHVKSA